MYAHWYGWGGHRVGDEVRKPRSEEPTGRALLFLERGRFDVCKEFCTIICYVSALATDGIHRLRLATIHEKFLGNFIFN